MKEGGLPRTGGAKKGHLIALFHLPVWNIEDLQDLSSAIEDQFQRVNRDNHGKKITETGMPKQWEKWTIKVWDYYPIAFSIK